jgi:hypothetical protein
MNVKVQTLMPQKGTMKDEKYKLSTATPSLPPQRGRVRGAICVLNERDFRLTP